MKRKNIIAVASIALTAALSTVPVMAQNARSYVSGRGSDSNACNFTTPCRSFAGAIAKTNAGGEITVLDPAGYGTVVINKAISIVNDGVGEAGIFLSVAGNAITIAAGANDDVYLRGLSLDGGGIANSNGIFFTSGKSLTLSNCVIRHAGHDGLGFFPNATTNLAVSNTVVSDNSRVGIWVAPSGSGAVAVEFNRVETNNNALDGTRIDGDISTGTVKATVIDSVSSGNANDGYFAITASGHAPTTLLLFRSVAANNLTGFEALGSGATIRLFHSAATGNSAGWTTSSSGVVQSYGNNAIDGNTSFETAPPSIAQK